LCFRGAAIVQHVRQSFSWSAQRTTALTIASFLNVLKYPPSLQFLLMTLGPTLVALALTERARGRVASWLSVYGRVPLFFYVTHLFVAHAVAVALAFAQGGVLRRIPIVNHPELIPAWYGVSLPGVYVAWGIVVLLLYFPCRQFAPHEGHTHGLVAALPVARVQRLTTSRRLDTVSTPRE
jgi:hypothetical protein